MNTNSIEQLANGRQNNLDLIRFFAATLVIYSHSFPLGSGDSSNEFILLLTNGSWNAGALAVATFFIISGFLITQSYERSGSLISFLSARILRIFPGLAFALLVSVFIIGPLFTKLTLEDYFLNSGTYEYLRALFLYPMKWNLPSLFENNIYKGSVNGALWTIPFEFICYLIVALLGILGMLRHKKFILFLFLLTIYYILFNSNISLGKTHIFGLEIITLMQLFSYFSAGMVLYLYRAIIPLNKYLAMICVLIMGFSFLFGGAKELFIIFGSYLVLYIGYNQKYNFSGFSKYGDFSYGLYIFAFPVQQSVTHLFGGKMSSSYNFLISFFVTLVLAIVSWHLVEKHALKLKRYPSNLLSSHQKIILQNTKQKFYTSLDKIFVINWPLFILASLLLFTSIVIYNKKPSLITFPYQKNNGIFQGQWLPQSGSENYRWISKSASVLLQRPNNATNLILEGFVPETFKELNKLQIFINEKEVTEMDIKPGNPITFNSGINSDSKLLNIRLEFNETHKPEPNAPDQRQMSALISKIELK